MIMKKLAIISSFILFIAAIAQANDTTYVWTGGDPGYSGQIVLDSSSSAGGSLADIVSINITTPTRWGGSFSFDPETVVEFQTPFTWNSSEITSMDIEWSYKGGLPSTPSIGGGFAEVDAYGYYGDDLATDTAGRPRIDGTGLWLAAAPDATSTIGLLGAALCGLRLLRRFRVN